MKRLQENLTAEYQQQEIFAPIERASMCDDCNTATYNMKCDKCVARWNEVYEKFWKLRGVK